MSAYRIVGRHAIPESDFRNLEDNRIRELSGELQLESSMMPTENGMESVAEFKPIGPGKPLTIEIRHVYSGKYPKGGLFKKSDDVAVVSGVKDYSVFSATARALNFIQRNHRKHGSFKTPSAFSDGTPVVAHYPALTSDSLTMSIELAVDDFPQEFVNSLGGAFQKLGGVPLMLPHSGFLLGLGEVLKLSGSIGNALFDSKPEFSITESINFDRAGSIVAEANFHLLTKSATLYLEYEYNDRVGMVHKVTNKPYEGDEPYVVISLDGRPRENLKDFAPTAASASILKGFFNIGEDVRTPIDTVVEGIKLASDMRFREKALDIKRAMDALPDDSDDREGLKEQFDALVKNIGNELIKPDADS